MRSPVSRFFVSPDSAEGWAKGLARAEHWKSGFSAHSLAYTWHGSEGFPSSVASAFDASELGPLEFIAGIPEYKVALPGGETASQTDLFVLSRAVRTGDTVAIAVEGKAREPFGDQSVADWRKGESEGKAERLRFLLRVLGLADDEDLGGQRYQLLHRAASPVIESKRLNADHAVMLVHSFGGENRWFSEFATFARLLGAEANVGAIVRAKKAARSLFLGWISDPHPRG